VNKAQNGHNTQGTLPPRSTLDRAVRKSETYRAMSVIALMLIAIVLQSVRLGFSDLTTGFAIWFGYAAIGITIFYELTCIVYIRWKEKAQKPLSRLFAYKNAIAESIIPTLTLAVIWHHGILPANEALVTPAILVYTIFIMLSVLHFSAKLSLFAGAACAAQHAGLVTYALLTAQIDSTSASINALFLYSHSAVLLLNGFAAAFVASRLNAHVRSQLIESHRSEGMQQEMDIASRVQRNLLPNTPPVIRGYDIDGWNRPADQTGGDYYDWQPLPDGTLALSVADVTGHGLGPALVTAFCRAYARATIQPGVELENVVSRINTLLSDDLPGDRFVTFVVALLSPGERHIRLLSAGHGPILIYRHAAGSIDTRAADGVPLGIMRDTVFKRVEPIALDVGDALVLITDGFFEWANTSGEQFGIARLKESIRKACARSGDSAAIIASVRTDVEYFTRGTPQPDDLTIVIARRTEDAQ